MYSILILLLMALFLSTQIDFWCVVFVMMMLTSYVDHKMRWKNSFGSNVKLLRLPQDFGCLENRNSSKTSAIMPPIYHSIKNQYHSYAKISKKFPILTKNLKQYHHVFKAYNRGVAHLCFYVFLTNPKIFLFFSKNKS